MHHLQEKLQLKAGRLRNGTIANQILMFLPLYERRGKLLVCIFNTYNESLPECEEPVV